MTELQIIFMVGVVAIVAFFAGFLSGWSRCERAQKQSNADPVWPRA